MNPINIRHLSVKCGRCGTYQTLAAFTPGEEWNVYTYQCEDSDCDPDSSRTLLEVPVELDAFARRDPTWHGGKRHAGADHGHGHDDVPPVENAAEPGDGGGGEGRDGG